MKVDMKFEVAIVPVSDVDRAKAFYTKLGWRVDDDIVNGKVFAPFSLRRRTRRPRSRLAKELRTPSPARSVVG
jgi:catechol 2,3-dioxygenase-like lactoylglutathione lyase family enzyme